MVEKALDVLTLHLMWKAKGLFVAEDSENDQYKDVLLEQREALIDKLKEYAVGNQSNTAEAVKRAVSINSFFKIAFFSSLISPGLQAYAEHPRSVHARSTSTT